MLIGSEKLETAFKQLAKTNRLSHGYIFFGEPETGKFSFALALAAHFESGIFEPTEILYETLILKPDEKQSIGIDAIRDLKRYLSQTPINSRYRIGIINDAERLTDQAENAILKIAEEPPPTGLIFLIVANPEVLLPTLQSRFQKIYFPRVASGAIQKLLQREFKLSKTEAEKIAQISFGRPGRAITLAANKTSIINRVSQLKQLKRASIEEASETSGHLELVSEVMAELGRDPIKNYRELKSILSRLTILSQFAGANKRLQLEAALWNI